MALSSHFPLPKTLHALFVKFALFVCLCQMAQQLNSAFGVTSEVTSQNVEGGTEPSLKVNCFYTDMKQLHLHWLNKSFMLYPCIMGVQGGHRFSVQGPRAIDYSLLTMSLWCSKSIYVTNPMHLSQAALADECPLILPRLTF